MAFTGLDWAEWIGIAGGIGGLVGGVAALLAWLGPSRGEVMEDLSADAAFRSDTAARLCDGSLGRRYREGVDRGLRGLDRAFGPPGSAEALGFCFIVALVYAFAGFFVVWGLGGPGVVGGFQLLPEAMEQPVRLVHAALLAFTPLVCFWLGRKVGPPIRRLERRLVTRLQHARRRRGRRSLRQTVDELYRSILAAAFVLLFAVSAAVLGEQVITPVAFELFLVRWPF